VATKRLKFPVNDPMEGFNLAQTDPRGKKQGNTITCVKGPEKSRLNPSRGKLSSNQNGGIVGGSAKLPQEVTAKEGTQPQKRGSLHYR